MNISGNTILFTGGASGIGKALAIRFAQRGNKVIVCGRRDDVLNQLRSEHPEIETIQRDVGNPDERESLFEQCTTRFPDVNVLVNNAGIQRRVDLNKVEDWQKTQQEIAINLEAPIHLSELFQQHFKSMDRATIISVTSGLSFMPLANVPVYCATKAALHSFTLSLRWQLKDTNTEVIEIIPPAVDTDLQAPGLHTFGVNVDEFADSVFAELEKGETEIAYGTALTACRASRNELDGIYTMMNSRFH
jgi:uncharacterized oxidoreductase